MGLSVEIESTPELVDPATGRFAGGPVRPAALDRFLDTPGVAGTPVEADLMAWLTAASQAASADETAAGRSGWDALRWWLAPEIHRVVGTEWHRVELAGYWLTLPGVPGAEVTLTVTAATSVERAASFTIAGIGGGPTFTIAVKQGLVHKTATAQRATLTTTAVFEKIQVTKEGRVLGAYPRLMALDEANVDWDFPTAVPPSPAELGQAASSTGYNFTRNQAADTVQLEVDRGTTWEVSAGLSLDKLGGIEAKVTAKVAYERAASYEYSLPPGHRYRASWYTGFPAYLWSVEGPE